MKWRNEWIGWFMAAYTVLILLLGMFLGYTARG